MVTEILSFGMNTFTGFGIVSTDRFRVLLLMQEHLPASTTSLAQAMKQNCRVSVAIIVIFLCFLKKSRIFEKHLI